MKVMLFSVHDVVSGIFFAPVAFRNEGVARRYFADLLKNDSNLIAKHPEDYELFLIGEFDNDSGELFSLPLKLVSTGNSAL